MATCPTCHQEIQPSLAMADYYARALPRIDTLNYLGKKIQDEGLSWDYSPEAVRWKELMAAQGADELAAGL